MTATQPEATLDIDGDRPTGPEGFVRVVLVVGAPSMPVDVALLTKEDAAQMVAYIRARRVA